MSLKVRTGPRDSSHSSCMRLYKTQLVRVVLAGGVTWFLIMISLTLGDYLKRGWLPFPGK